MSNYNQDNRSGGESYRGGGNYRGRDSGRRQMHKAVCDECGKNCEVPFKPSGGKPIYCSSCFEGKEGGGSRRSSRRGSSNENRDNTHKQLLEQVGAINSKLDRILNVIEASVKEKKPDSKNTETKKVAKKTPAKSKKSVTKKASKKKAKKSSKKT